MYAQWAVDPSQSPPWLLGKYGSAWLSAHGALADVVVQWCKEAVKAHFATLCPSDALALLGEERGLPRGSTESDASYRARIQGAWDFYRYAGTAFGLLWLLYAAGYTALIQTQGSGRQFSLVQNPAGNPQTDLVFANLGSVNLGGSPTQLGSDIAIFITQPWPAAWGGVAPANGSGDQQFVSGLIGKFKPAHCRCVKLVVVSGPVLGLAGLDWGVVATPVNAAFTQGSGTLATGTYYYRVSALNVTGETLASAETSKAITGPAGVNVNWGAVTGATGYKVYGRTTGAEQLLATVGSVTTWLDNGSITPSGALPSSNTTGWNLGQGTTTVWTPPAG